MKNKVFDIAIFGAGVVGANIFSDAVNNGYKAVLIESAPDVATGASKANSGIVHAGFDAKPGTLKARFNVEGNAIMPVLCARLHVPLKKCGSFVLGNDLESLEKLLQQGHANSVKGLCILDANELIKKIPNLNP